MKISLKDFPENIYVQLNKEFLNKCFRELKRKITQKKLAEKLGITEITISRWKLKKGFLPLKFIREIKKINGVGWKEIEKNTTAYKSKQDRNVVKNPKLKIKDSKALREIVIHIMADGCASSNYAAYYNYDENTKYEFIKELNEVFGEVETKYYINHINFPMAIPHILSKHFKVNFLSKKCRVPKEFFYKDKYSIAVIRAMLIDEGTIDGSNIRLDSSNRAFLEDIKKICDKLKIKTGKTWESKGPIYRFNILAESLKEAYTKIKPLPIENKENLLEFACRTQTRDWKYELPGSTKIKVVKKLIEKPLTSVELSQNLKLHRKRINNITKWLEKENIIEKSGKKKYTNIFRIKNIRLAKDFIKNPFKLIKGNKFQRYGITQLKILKFLKSNKKVRFTDLLNEIKIGKSGFLKCLRGMVKKRLINKTEKYYKITRKGANIEKLKPELARVILYSNVNDFSKTGLNFSEQVSFGKIMT